MKLPMLCLALVGCPPVDATPAPTPITIVQAHSVTAEGDALARCRAVGRDAGTFAAYEECTKEAGL